MLDGARMPVLLVAQQDRPDQGEVPDSPAHRELQGRYSPSPSTSPSLRAHSKDSTGCAPRFSSGCPKAPRTIPPDYLTDQPERFIAAELIREKILAETRQEVPHSVAVLVDRWEETPHLTRISATIYVEREGQKGILIGVRGAMLKEIGTRARLEMERLFGRKIFLELFVRVQPKWRENQGFLNELDWRSVISKNE